MAKFGFQILCTGVLLGVGSAFASLPIDGFEFTVLRVDPPQMRICGPTKGTLFEGDLVIPDSVVRPIDGRKYAVVEIGSFDGNVRDTLYSGWSAFFRQPLITSVTIPRTVTEIWHDAFRECPGIREWKVASDNPEFTAWEGALYRKSKKPSGAPDELLRFPAASPLTEWTIPEATEDMAGEYRYVAKEAFRDNSTLKTLNIGPTVWLYDYSFEGNVGITEFRGSGARSGMEKEGMIFSADGKTLRHVPAGRTGVLDIPESVTRIGRYALAGSHYSAVNFNNVAQIGERAFIGSHFREMTIPASVTSLDYGLFEECRELETAVIETKITDVFSFMFRNCTALKSVTLPTSCRGLRNECFYGCRALQNFSLANYTRLGMGAPYVDEQHFAMSGITKMNWPSKVGEIPDKMFFGCRSFKSVALKESTQVAGRYAFWGTGIESFNTLNLSWVNDYALDGCLDLKKIVIAESDHTLMLGACAFRLNTDTEVYLDHKDLYYQGWNTKPEQKDDWPDSSFVGRMDEIRLYTSLLDPEHFLPRWKVVYCPALTSEFYGNLYPKGNVAEMFTLAKEGDQYKATANYNWVDIAGVTETSAGLDVRYRANGENLHTVYPWEMLIELPSGLTPMVSNREECWHIEGNRLISADDELEIVYLCTADGHTLFSGRLSARSAVCVPTPGLHILKWHVGGRTQEKKILIR